MSHPAPDKPFAIWRVFHDAPRWWFARGCPPTLIHDRGWSRALRTSALLGAMGACSGGTAALEAVLAYWLRFTGHALWVPGICFGVIVLVPLSRWLGRGWFWVTATIPVAIAASFVNQWSHRQSRALFLIWNESLDWQIAMFLRGSLAGMLDVAILALWLGPWSAFRRRPLLLLSILLVGMLGHGLADFGTLALSVAKPDLHLHYLVFAGVYYAMVFIPLQTVMAIALGIPLWELKPSAGITHGTAPVPR